MVYFVLSLLIVVDLILFAIGIGVITHSKYVDQYFQQNKLSRLIRKKSARVYGMTEDEWLKLTMPSNPQSFRLWGIRVWGGTVVAFATIVLSVLIVALIKA